MCSVGGVESKEMGAQAGVGVESRGVGWWGWCEKKDREEDVSCVAEQLILRDRVNKEHGAGALISMKRV